MREPFVSLCWCGAGVLIFPQSRRNKVPQWERALWFLKFDLNYLAAGFLSSWRRPPLDVIKSKPQPPSQPPSQPLPLPRLAQTGLRFQFKLRGRQRFANTADYLTPMENLWLIIFIILIIWASSLVIIFLETLHVPSLPHKKWNNGVPI